MLQASVCKARVKSWGNRGYSTVHTKENINSLEREFTLSLVHTLQHTQTIAHTRCLHTHTHTRAHTHAHAHTRTCTHPHAHTHAHAHLRCSAGLFLLIDDIVRVASLSFGTGERMPGRRKRRSSRRSCRRCFGDRCSGVSLFRWIRRKLISEIDRKIRRMWRRKVSLIFFIDLKNKTAEIEKVEVLWFEKGFATSAVSSRLKKINARVQLTKNSRSVCFLSLYKLYEMALLKSDHERM